MTDTTDPVPERCPATVHTLAATATVLAITGLVAAATIPATAAATDDRAPVAVAAGVYGILAAATAVALWRAWPAAWWLTITVAVVTGVPLLAAGPCGIALGVAIGGGMLWSLFRPETRWWLRRD